MTCARAARATAVLGVLAVGYPVVARTLWRSCRSLAGPALAGESGSPGVDSAVGAAAAALALVLTTWFVVTLAVTVAATAGRHPSPHVPGTPHAVRRLAALLLGAGLAAGQVWVPAATAGQHDPLGSVDRPVSAGPRVPDRPAPSARSLVVVRPGDSLWAIAARRLTDGSSAGRPAVADVARAWPHWHHANRAVIGPDADRLTPGQRLHPPTSKETR